ncbi:hypothetical protein niasHT_007307 [Heterodera trifolii]|uniref:FYVE-type domain-containing protein n=1 Tax=Heterodera trifolii TaxID=157864 RepID=A0ABD2LM80_9BILA
METSALPDMDELLDRLENEPLQLVVELPSQFVAIKNEFPPNSNSNSAQQNSIIEQEQQQREKQVGVTTCDNNEESDRNLQNVVPKREEKDACLEAHGQIVPEQEKEKPIQFQCQRLVHDKQSENRMHTAEECILAFKDGYETNEKNDEDIFEQIDQMAAQINAEELDQEIEEARDEEIVKKSDLESNYYLDTFPMNSQSLENFVEEMVDSILQRVLEETTDVDEKNGQNPTEIKEEMEQFYGETDRGQTETEAAKEAGETEAQKVSNVPQSRPLSPPLPSSSIVSPPLPSSSACPSSSHSQPFTSQTTNHRNDCLAIVHDLSIALDEFKLTESELQLGKKKPYWIPDEECLDCMLCATRFSIVNRRHHCRACGRVLCRVCCSKRRLLAYMDEKEGKQRVCIPCNRTLDRIVEYEQRMNSSDQRDNSNGEGMGEETDQSKNSTISEATRQQTEQKSDAIAHSLRQSADFTPTNCAPPRPKKKSLLKQSAVAPPTLVADHRTEVAASNGPDNGQTLQQTRPISVSVTNSKRSVTFRDGVNPGHDGTTPNSQLSGQNCTSAESDRSVAGPSLYQWLVSGGDRPNSTDGHSFVKKPFIPTAGNGTNISPNDNKKLPRKMSRRSREKRMEEEAQSLLILKADANQTQNQCRIWSVELRSDGFEELVRRELAEVARELCDAEKERREWTIALRRNFHLRIERGKICAEDPFPTLAVSTRGLASLGVDELFLAFQFDPTIFGPNELNPKSDLLVLLQQYELIFQQCLVDPEEVHQIDHKMGIRKCVSRMTRLYPCFTKDQSIFGHKAAALLFHRPHYKQNFANFRPPSHPFLIGIFVQKDELPLAKCVPCRLLLRLGMLYDEYPFPVVNVRRERPLFTANSIQSSVLKVLNDFRFWSYRMARLSGCIVAIRETTTVIILSSWALDDVRQIVAGNRNMIGWALDQLSSAADADEEDGVTEIDSHLVCVQEETDDGVTPSFSTRVFSSSESNSQSTLITTKKVIGVSFLIFDGALRGNEQLSVSLVEDGLVVRLNADLMEQLIKALTTGDYFSVSNEHGHSLFIAFRDTNDLTESGQHKASLSEARKMAPGALHSPIDGKPLEGHVQYGLDRSRLLRSLYFFQFSSEWALRLSAVINMLPGKFPSALQPRFFDLCEQLAKQIVPTLEPFLRELIAVDQRSIALRVHIDGEVISYETEKWVALPEQHFVWTVTLDEQLIPFLYGLCSWLPSVFFVELHTFIVSTRPLPALTVPDSPGDS